MWNGILGEGACKCKLEIRSTGERTCVAGGPACTKAIIPQEGEENRVRFEAWRDAGIAVKARIAPFAHTTAISHLGKLSREFQKGLETSHR